MDGLVATRTATEPHSLSAISDLVADIESLVSQWQHRQRLTGARGQKLLAGLAALVEDAAVTSSPNGDGKILERARSAVLSQLHRAPSVSEIAGHACVCPRTLELVFKRNGLPSPMAWARQQRLQRVRDDLLSAARQRQPVNITRVAMSYGFTHMGRFAAQYRQQYGTSPSATLACH